MAGGIAAVDGAIRIKQHNHIMEVTRATKVYLGQIAGPRQRVDDSLLVAVEAQCYRRTAQQH